MTLIKDLIEIPERVSRDEFVLRLTEGVARPEETLRSYVVTPQLAECFDRALGLIRQAVQAGSSRASYLHGSFGSGKSHFMAVLHLLLQRNPAARAQEGLEGVVTEHDAWLEGKRFLLVPYHMIGQRSMESAVLGGYVDRVRALHPEAPPPGVYRAEGLFRDARQHRKDLGDETFFARLNEAAGGGDGGSGWGELAGRWDAASFEAALGAAPGAEERSRLVSALVGTFFQAYRDVARGGAETFVSLDEGLAIVSRHAAELGYDGLIFFLDELILWLATHASDLRFLNEEGPKVAKLVEAASADRPIPIVSFVARQRDLRELVGERVTGAEELGFAEGLGWWEARFEKITLEDRNLPEIAARRILRPRSEAARQQIDAAYRETERIREEVFETLLTPRADRSMFRKVYPFSPALVETLVAVSSLLQRERTALKVMVQLLVAQRETLELGELVPVGDLFDVIAGGEEPFTEGMRRHFENARRLYTQKFLPLLEREHGLTKERAAELPVDDAGAQAFRADDRLVKTLLLAALVPEVEVLKGITAARLAALNHGSIRTPIPGREGQEVLRRCRRWAADVGELRVGDDPDNPTIAVQLESVDTQAILDEAKTADNAGNRKRKIRELLFRELGIDDRDEHQLRRTISWRGTRRDFEIVFTNVRELPDESLTAREGGRKVILDFPFDEPGHSPTDDLARLEAYRRRGRPTRTLAWVPSFLSASAQNDLGRLLCIDHVLAGERFRDYARHLSPIDQNTARELLGNQQSQLHHRLVHYLEAAYGTMPAPPGAIDETHALEEHLQSLDPGFAPRPPVGANLRAAFEQLLGQMLESQYPDHPELGTEIRPSVLRKVYEEVSRGVQDPEGRVAVDKSLRPLLRQVAEPLQLGEMGETHFAIGRAWYDRFDRLERPLTVAKLRAATDQPRPRGLPEEVQNLLILVFADQAGLAFRRHGGPFEPSLERLPDDLELRPVDLPSPEAWDAAYERAGKLFGIAVPPLRSAGNASTLAERLGEAAAQALEPARAACARLESLARDYHLAPADMPRLHTLHALVDLLETFQRGEGRARVEALAAADIPTSPEALGTAFRKAEPVRHALETAHWDILEAATGLDGERAEAAATLRRELCEALAMDEYAIGLAEKLRALENRAAGLLAAPPPAAGAGASESAAGVGVGAGAGPGVGPGAGAGAGAEAATPRPAPPPAGVEVVEERELRELDLEGLREAMRGVEERLREDPDLRVRLAWVLTRRRGGS